MACSSPHALAKGSLAISFSCSLSMPATVAFVAHFLPPIEVILFAWEALLSAISQGLHIEVFSMVTGLNNSLH